MNRHRILQGTAMTTAVALTAGYVWWAHYQASARTSATHPETPPPAQEQSPEILVFDASANAETPNFHANGLALSSKSFSMPVLSTRQDNKENSTAPIEKQEAQVFSGFGIISGSKSIGRPIDISIPKGKALDLTSAPRNTQVSLPQSDDTVPPLLRRPQ